MPGHLDPRDAALFATIALALVLAGAVLAASGVAIEQKASAMAAIVAALALVAYRGRRGRPPGDDGL